MIRFPLAVLSKPIIYCFLPCLFPYPDYLRTPETIGSRPFCYQYLTESACSAVVSLRDYSALHTQREAVIISEVLAKGKAEEGRNLIARNVSKVCLKLPSRR